MAISIYPDFPPELNGEQTENLLSNLKDWTITNGLAVRPSPALIPRDVDPFSALAVTAPVTLFPSPFPHQCFEEAKALQPVFNLLYSSISKDESWLGEVIEELVEVDDFIAKLWHIHIQVKEEGYAQPLTLGLFRSDYMVHVDPSTPTQPQIKQVEFNTIASSFGGLSSQVSRLHRHLHSSSVYPPTPVIAPDSLPQNLALEGLAFGLATAHIHYCKAKPGSRLPVCILFLVQDEERNVFDQRHLEYQLSKAHSIRSFRLTFSSFHARISIESTNPLRPLIYRPSSFPSTSYQVSVVYFRAGYSPNDYLSESDWSARLHIERSAAIKCPSILTQLAGCKKVQQELATPFEREHVAPYEGELKKHRVYPVERFISQFPKSTIERLVRSFAVMYPLDDSPAGQEGTAIATDPERCKGYVLKPQREGGGNNIYRSAIPGYLEQLGSKELWKGYILMEIIEPPALRNWIFREGKIKFGEVIGELGIYGCCLWSTEGKNLVGQIPWARGKGRVLLSTEVGYLLRTKGRESDEGGVAAGFGAMDSVCLVDV